MIRISLLFLKATLILLAILLPQYLLAQKKDTTSSKSDTTKVKQIIDNIKDTRVSKEVMRTITRSNKSGPAAATVKSEDVFKPFEGKIIRSIRVRQIGFEKSVQDTARNIKNTITKVSNKLHSDTREWVIRDHLFIRENKPLNPYRMADNERYLRDLDFILDAKFYIIPLRHTKDSVDVIVMTRDVFAIGGSFSPSSATKTRFKIYDANLAGWGQRVQFNGMIDELREPTFGYEAYYRKNSIGGSFITGQIGYTQLNTGSSYGDEDEKAYYIRFDRPLVSPYTKFAGGIELSRNWSENFFLRQDSLFRNYRYIVNDFWIGYNMGSNYSTMNRDRHFIGIRAFNQRFTKQPFQLNERISPLYNNRTYVLGEITFFRQNFYTSRFIYGFGRTEDIPYGHTISLLFGWASQLGYKRPYIGLDAEKSIVRPTGEFYNLAMRIGGFRNEGFQDATILLSGSLTSRLIPFYSLMIRQTITADYTRLYKQRTSLPLDINNDYGIQSFAADSVLGTKRFHISSETLAFTKLKLLGFHFAGFTFGEMAMIADDTRSIFYDKPYFGFGGGIRTRNENLIFGTIELRLIYYPKTAEGMKSFNIRLSSNLRIKYTAGFVRAPSFIRYN